MAEKHYELKPLKINRLNKEMEESCNERDCEKTTKEQKRGKKQKVHF